MSAPLTDDLISDSDFQLIADIARREAGLAIPAGKKSLVHARVVRRIRALGLEDCHSYLATLPKNAQETQNLISELTTNVSHFFREAHHFQAVQDLLAAAKPTNKLRFWSAGCSNGQEPYSLAITALKTLPNAADRDILILATDIDRRVLEKAKSGVYTKAELEGVPAEDRSRFFEAGAGDTLTASDAVRALVRFNYLNLNGTDWPMQGLFDAILCRNVVIYFDEATKSSLWPRFHALLKPKGLLMLGHSERVQPVAGSGFENHGITTYRKI